MNGGEVINILTNFESDFVIGNIFGYCLRWLGWLIIQLLSKLSNGIESIVDTIYSLNNFFDTEGIKQIIDLFRPILFVALGLSIIYIGYKIITDRDFKGSKVINNITLSVMVIMLLPTLMVQINNVTNDGIKALNKNGNIEMSTTADQVIKSNITDLYYLDSKNFNINNDNNKNNIPLENIKDININEEIDTKKVKNKEVFKNKIVLNANGEKDIEKLDKEFFGLSQEKYFRYNFNFWIISISILCSVLVFLLTSIKVARLVYELAFIKIFAIFYAFADIGSGQGIRQILKHILSVFAVIFSTSILMKIYILFSGFVNSQNINEFSKIIFLIGGSLAVIDAPNIIERIFGIDAGLKSAWGVVAGAYSGAKTFGELGNFASKVGSRIMTNGQNIISATSGARGLANGFFSGDNNVENTTPLEEQMNNGSNKSPNPLEYDSKNMSSENMNMSDNISNLDENKNTSERSNNVSDTLDNNVSDTLDNNDINTNENSSLYQNSDIGENYGNRNSLSDDISQNTSTSNIDDGNSNSNINSLESQINGNTSLNDGMSIDSYKSSKLEDVSNPNSINDKPNIDNNSKRDIPKGDNSIETRSYGEYAKDKISNSDTMQRANKHYQLGQNTGIKLKQRFNKNIDLRIQKMKERQGYK